MELKLSGRFLGRRTDRRRLDRDQAQVHAQVRIENSEVVQGIGQVRLKVPLEVHLEGASFVRRQRRRQRLRRRRRRQQQPEGIDQTVDVCLGRLVRKRQKRRQQQQED